MAQVLVDENGVPLTQEEIARLQAMKQEPDVMPNGVPAAVVEKSPQQQLLDMVNSPEIQAQQQEMSRLAQQDLEAQRRAIAQDEAELEQARGQIDISPLLALSDSWTGSRLSPSYKSPQDKVQLLKEAIRKQRQTLSNAQIQMLKDQMGAGLAKQMGVQGRFDESQRSKKEDSVLKWKSQEIDEPLLEEQKNFSMMDNAFASNDYQMVMNLLAPFSRAVAGQKGVLTDRDITMVMPANVGTTWAKVQSYFNNTPSAKVPKEYTAKLRQLLAVAKRKSIEQKIDRLNLQQKSYDGSPGYVNVHRPILEPAREYLQSLIPSQEPQMRKTQKTKAAPKNKAPDFDKMSDEEIQKWIDANG